MTGRSARRRIAGALANAALALLALGLAALAAEAVVRLVAPPEVIEPYPAIYRPSEDPEIGYELRPNLRAYAYGASVATNSLGLRGPELAVPKPAGTWRLLAVGDSITFGYGVPGEAAFPAQLERLLRERCSGLRFEVVNAGVAGWNALQELAWLRTRGLALEPDAVVITFVRNDAGPPLAADADGHLHWGSARRPQTRLRDRAPRRALEVPFHGALRAHSWLFRLVELRYDRLRIRLAELRAPAASIEDAAAASAAADGSGYNAYAEPAFVLDTYLQTRAHAAAPTWRAIEERLQDAREALARRDAPLLLAAYNMPALFLNHLLALRDRTGIPFLGFAYHFGSGREYSARWTLGWDGHPNADAHALMARLLYERLLEEGMLPDAAQCRPFAERIGRDWDARYRADAARFEAALADALARVTASELPLDDPDPRPLGLLRGGGPLLPEDEVVALVRRPDGARTATLDVWTHPVHDAELRRRAALRLRVNGEPLAAQAIPGPGRVTLEWPLPEKAVGLLEVGVMLESPVEMRTDAATALPAVRLLRLAVPPVGDRPDP